MMLITSQPPSVRLPRRHGFIHALNLAVREARDDGQPLSVVVVEIDPARDGPSQAHHAELWSRVGQVLRLASGRSGVLAHVGDGVFAVLRRHTPVRQACELAERLRVAIEVQFAARKHPMTASVGVACGPVPGDGDGTALFDAAQRRCRDARAEGGNRVVCGPTDPWQDPPHATASFVPRAAARAR